MRRIAMVVSLVVASAASRAAAQSVVTNNASPVSVLGVNPFTTYFSELVGMKVTWKFSNNSTGSGTWASLGGGTYGIRTDSDCNNSGNFFCLTATGSSDTYGITDPYQWDLHAKNLVSFAIDPLSSGFAFDIVNSPTIGTPGSDVGRPFDYGNCLFGQFFCSSSDDDWNTTATYSEELKIGAAAPVGDLYGYLSVTFGHTFGTSSDGSHGDEAYFSQDIDKVSLDGTGGTLETTVTPEPGTMSMLAMGLVGMAGAVRRKARQKKA